MSKTSEFAETFRKQLGFKGRFILLACGIVGLFFPGIICYAVFSGMAKAMKDFDVRAMLDELEQG